MGFSIWNLDIVILNQCVKSSQSAHCMQQEVHMYDIIMIIYIAEYRPLQHFPLIQQHLTWNCDRFLFLYSELSSIMMLDLFIFLWWWIRPLKGTTKISICRKQNWKNKHIFLCMLCLFIVWCVGVPTEGLNLSEIHGNIIASFITHIGWYDCVCACVTSQRLSFFLTPRTLEQSNHSRRLAGWCCWHRS